MQEYALVARYSLEELSNYQRIRRDPVTSTAFQLNKICAVTHEEMKKLDIEVFELAYEAFIQAPKEKNDDAFV